MSDTDAAAPLPPIPPGGLLDRMGITISEVSPERAVGTMPVEGNTQPYGLLHGGASAVLAETLGSLASMAHVLSFDPDGVAVGVDLNITHVRGMREGNVIGTATAVHRGRSVAVYSVTVRDESGQTVAEARITCALKTRR